jgi:UDPglucose--hexose-1-phosphate uridylyltransferase
MPELRQDLVTGRWVAIATQRARRPSSFTRAAAVAVPAASRCPFCEGHEGMTPPEVMAYREKGTAPDTPGWSVRAVPNLYPAFGPANGTPTLSENGPYRTMNGVGVHEVIVHSPDHERDLAELPRAQVEEVVRAYQDRYDANRENPNIQYLLIIDNHGKEAGASLEHPHSQLFGIPMVPPTVQEEIDGLRSYRREHASCAYCDILAYERRSGERVIFENPHFLVYAPFASRTPFEMQLLPKWQTARFETLTAEQRRDFASALQQATGRLAKGLNDPPYNFYIHTAPAHAGPDLDYHWHLEILPKLAIPAGFELGSGIMINTVTPEAAAEFLRGVDPSEEVRPTAASGLH